MKQKTNQQKISRRKFVKKAAIGLATVAGGISGMISCGHSPGSPDQHREFLKAPVGSADQNGDSQNNQFLFHPGILPRRILGKTGLEISMLAFGGGSQFMKNGDGTWEKLLQRAVEAGVNYFDNASSYGGSEARYAEILAPIRKQIYIATKFDGKKDNIRNVDVMMDEVETSLKRLKTDYIDVLLIHDINNDDDVSPIENTIFKQMQKLKDAGVAKFIGFSSMNSAPRSKELIEKLDFDVALMAMNPTNYGSYSTIALPAAENKKMGILAMKVMRDIVGVKATAKELINYILSKNSVSSMVIAHDGLEKFEENFSIVSNYGDTSVEDNFWGLEHRLESFAGPHALCWARSEYIDACGLA